MRGDETAMMGWYVGDHMTGWGWVGMTLSSVLFVALLVLGGLLLLRVARQSDRPAEPVRSPEQLLAERFARGELSDEQYRQQMATLRDTGALPR
jgi:putative membrane protein